MTDRSAVKQETFPLPDVPDIARWPGTGPTRSGEAPATAGVDSQRITEREAILEEGARTSHEPGPGTTAGAAPGKKTRPLVAGRLIAGLAAALIAGRAAAERPAPRDRSTLQKVARELMEKARFCALVTNAENGYPRARAIDAFAPEADMTVWIATNPVTRKVAEVKKDPRVTLYYFEPAGPGYVTLQGRATVVALPAESAKRWKEDWACCGRSGGPATR